MGTGGYFLTSAFFAVKQTLFDGEVSGSTAVKVNIPSDSSSELLSTFKGNGDATCNWAVDNFRFALLQVLQGLVSTRRSLHGCRRLR